MLTGPQIALTVLTLYIQMSGMITKGQLNQLWNENGLKYRFSRFHKFLSERGLLPFITEEKLLKHLYELLENFLVKGIKETKDGQQILPTGTGRT